LASSATLTRKSNVIKEIVIEGTEKCVRKWGKAKRINGKKKRRRKRKREKKRRGVKKEDL